ncbi:conserved hypothetical protein [Trichinella spiralis]|uniref:hypothetical protein n=1 Tax=Trichinella spiralis TaxID=6334 RepID=UPI0001EFF074|nr:conserved hypothetical protein [Trichinella spiralis]
MNWWWWWWWRRRSQLTPVGLLLLAVCVHSACETGSRYRTPPMTSEERRLINSSPCFLVTQMEVKNVTAQAMSTTSALVVWKPVNERRVRGYKVCKSKYK